MPLKKGTYSSINNVMETVVALGLTAKFLYNSMIIEKHWMLADEVPL